ncbi:uncharacterized protein LOC141907628 [Tubulanus polymorphus]|uniref:uncharacterized protein LOC141907628 n=1 Tax=Tubulanus polymorphus TaxID=672921 RepID=UPI003DA21BF5
MAQQQQSILSFTRRRPILTELSPSPRRGNQIQNMLRVSDVLTPSPDEQVIKIRGRRESNSSFTDIDDIPDIWGEDVVDGAPPSAVTLNSRKRLALSSPIRRSPRNSPRKSPWKSPASSVGVSPLRIVGRNLTAELLSPPQSPKRARVIKKKSTPLETCLKALTLQQMSELLLTIVNKHPDIEDEIRECLPAPDLKPLEDKLKYLEKNIFKSFPNTRWGSSRDAFCYRRVKTHLDAFKKTCSDQGRSLVQSHSWDSVVEYTCIAWYYINRLPVWDNSIHNKSQTQCYRNLSGQCMAAVKKSGWNHHRLNIIREKLNVLKEYSNEIDPVIVQIDKMLSK